MMRFHLMEISPTMASALTTESNMSRYMYITVVMSKNTALCTMMETDLQKNGKESKWNLNKIGYHISSRASNRATIADFDNRVPSTDFIARLIGFNLEIFQKIFYISKLFFLIN